MSAMRTLTNHQLRHLGKGRFERKRPFKRTPFSSVGLLGIEWGHLHMLHFTKGRRVRHMSDRLFNLIQLSSPNPEAALAKVREYWNLVMETARKAATERHYPLT